jgi:acetyl esterase/lipase
MPDHGEPDSLASRRPPSSRWRWLAAVLFLFSLLAVGAALARPGAVAARLERVVAVTDISYGEGPRQKLDVYTPRRRTAAPVIVFFYGGRWQSGTKSWYSLLAATLAARGYVVVVPDYRLYPEVKFPDFLVDGADAVRWARQNAAAHGGDPHRLFIMGHSAGAYIAAMLALDPQWLNGVGLDPDRDVAGLIGISGPYDFLPLTDPTLVEIFGGPDRASTMPISFAEGHKPPALLFTGGADTIVEAGNTIRLADKLRQSGNDARAVIYRRRGHITVLIGFAPILGRFLPTFRQLDAFVARASVKALPRVSGLAGVTP